MNIIILGWPTITNGDISPDCFKKFGNVELYGVLDEDDACNVVSNAEAILVNRMVITERIITSAPNLKYIGSFATGYNNIDIGAAKKHGVTVTNVPGYSTEAVAAHTMAFLLASALQIVKYDEHVKSGGWSFEPGCDCFPFKTHELSKKVLGIYGFGNIGKRVAELANAFGMEVIFYSGNIHKSDFARQVGFDTLIKNSDFLSLHAPLTKDTEKVFNEAVFQKMKPTAYLINTARGGLVDEDALASALNNDIIAGAAVDVTANEPLCEKSLLFNAKNCIFTPHVAWGPIQTRERLVRLTYKNLEMFIKNKPINVVEE